MTVGAEEKLSSVMESDDHDEQVRQHEDAVEAERVTHGLAAGILSYRAGYEAARRAAPEPEPGSFEWTVQRLSERGLDEARVVLELALKREPGSFEWTVETLTESGLEQARVVLELAMKQEIEERAAAEAAEKARVRPRARYEIVVVVEAEDDPDRMPVWAPTREEIAKDMAPSIETIVRENFLDDYLGSRLGVVAIVKVDARFVERVSP